MDNFSFGIKYHPDENGDSLMLYFGWKEFYIQAGEALEQLKTQENGIVIFGTSGCIFLDQNERERLLKLLKNRNSPYTKNLQEALAT